MTASSISSFDTWQGLMGRADLAIVCLLCAAPWAWALCRLRPMRAWRLLALFGTIGIAAFALGHLAKGEALGFISPTLWRASLATGVVGVMGLVLLRRGRSQGHAWQAVFAAFVALVVPIVYADAITRDLEDRVVVRLGQSRLAEAAAFARSLRNIDYRAVVADRNIEGLLADLETQIKELRQRRESADVPDSADERMAAAREWAMLGETDRAIETAAPLVVTSTPDPRAYNLLGTIAQADGAWEESGAWFQKSLDLTRYGTAFPEARIEALLGIGFAERKQGDLPVAEAAYLKAARLKPSADIYFVVAQFYGDHQRASEAVKFARKAAEHDAAYRPAAAALIDQATTREFGCLPVFLGRGNAAALGNVGGQATRERP